LFESSEEVAGTYLKSHEVSIVRFNVGEDDIVSGLEGVAERVNI